ncbi:MAG: ATP-binding protein [Gemmatimonadales bacterium]
MSVALSWSGGKDAAWTLELLRQGGVEVASLVTTVTREFDRVAIHGVRRTIVRQQAAVLGLPLIEVELPYPCSNDLYEFAFGSALRNLKNRFGVSGVAFGDLFLRDVRAYRERLLEPLGLEPLFPLWGIRTDLLIRNMIRSGLVAHIVALDPARVPARFAGWAIDRRLVDELPAAVDPCGENGEFHTLVTDGPMFPAPITVYPGEVVEREGMVYADFRLTRNIDE